MIYEIGANLRAAKLLARHTSKCNAFALDQVKKLVDALRMHHILKSSDDKDSDEGSRASDAAQTKEESETGKDDYEVPHVEGESDRA